MGIVMGNDVILEERGRILIPKVLREKLRMKPGQRLHIESKGDEIVIKPASDVDRFFRELRGCVKGSKVDPLELKRIWEKK